MTASNTPFDPSGSWLEVKVVTNPRDKDLLITYEAFKKAIPDPNEREDLSTLRDYIRLNSQLEKKTIILKRKHPI